jgi:hypothetical protein
MSIPAIVEYYWGKLKENNEINVIYRRKEGGVGIIMPQMMQEETGK